MIKRGAFITFEGGEGAGKSTQIARLAEWLRERGSEVVVTREPGGSAGAEAVRHVILSGAAEPLGPAVEAALFAAARADHVQEIIRPALRRGAIVLSDRFLDSSRVYQGGSGELDERFLTSLERVAIDGAMPDLTLILDIDPEEGLTRARARRGEGEADRFEKEALAIHGRRRRAFLAIAKAEPDRCTVIDASGDADKVAAAVRRAVERRMELIAIDFALGVR